MKITGRKIIVSIVIASLMLILGLFISDSISDAQNDRNAEYYKALHIETSDIFQYSMDTNVGNAFIFGELQAVNPVGYDEIPGEYIWVQKIEEHYNRHTRTVTKTRVNSNGKRETYKEEEEYYTWDYYDSWEKHSDKIKFLGIEFDFSQIGMPEDEHIDTQSTFLSKVRYVYKGIPNQVQGTIYAKLLAGTILGTAEFYEGMSIDQALKYKTTGYFYIFFWILWILLTAAVVYGFVRLENYWLE